MKNTTLRRRLAAHYVYHRRSLLRNAIVSWSSDGRVAGVEVPGRLDACAEVEFYNGILIPDLVDAHCHLAPFPRAAVLRLLPAAWGTCAK